MHSSYRKSRRVMSTIVLKEEDTKVVLEVDMDMVRMEDTAEGEVDPPLVSIVEKLVMYQGFVTNRECFVHTTTILSMSLKTVPNC
jgi:hypothetical protein